MRIVDPARVASWFRPPAQSYLEALRVEPNGTSQHPNIPCRMSLVSNL
jgi:hypothetical protein